MAANPYIKRAHAQSEYSPFQLLELERCSEDPIYFMENYVKVQHPTDGVVPFKLYEYQREIIDLIHNNKDSLILCSRQLGKTTLAAIYILWFATFHEAKECVIASKNMGHAVDIMERIKFAYEELPNWLKAGCLFFNRTSIKFDNNSVIKSQATTEKTGRGNSPAILMLDEVSFVARKIQEKIWASIAPSLSTGGKLIMTTTPNGDQDLFARLWRGSISGNNNFKNITVLYTRHPDRGPESGYREDMISKLGELTVRVELDCEFLSTDALLVSSMRLAELRSRIHDYEDNGFRFWSQPERSPMYLVGVDVATGSGQDYSVVEVFAFPSLQQVAQYRSNELKIPALYDKIKWILNRLSKPVNNRRPDVMWTFERNAIGEAISALYNTDELQPEHAELINDVPGKFGMVTTARSKVLACMQLKALIEKIRNGLNLNSDMNIFELKNFIATGGSYAGKQGATDDTVMALLLIVRLIKYVADFDPDAHRIMYSHDEHDYEDDLEMTDEPIAFIA